MLNIICSFDNISRLMPSFLVKHKLTRDVSRNILKYKETFSKIIWTDLKYVTNRKTMSDRLIIISLYISYFIYIIPWAHLCCTGHFSLFCLTQHLESNSNCFDSKPSIAFSFLFLHTSPKNMPYLSSLCTTTVFQDSFFAVL